MLVWCVILLFVKNVDERSFRISPTRSHGHNEVNKLKLGSWASKENNSLMKRIFN